MRLCLAVYEDDPALKEDARRIWTSFGEADVHPLGRTRPFLLIDTMERIGDYAGIMLKNNSVQFLRSRFAYCHSLKQLTSTVSESAADR